MIKKVGAAPAPAGQPFAARCIIDPKRSLTAAQKSAIVSAARSIDLRLSSGKRLRMVREGTSVVFEPRGVVSDSKARVFSGTLRGELLKAQQALPAEVNLKCGQ